MDAPAPPDPKPQTPIEQLRELATKVGDANDADVLLYSGAMAGSAADTVVEACTARRRRANVTLALATYGGDADAAYRIARCLRRHYRRITVLIAGYCKSAGTLLVLGADDLAMNEYAELGPLDVQVPKADEYERSSGLTPMRALMTLDARARTAFVEHFVHFKFDMDMTTRTAADIAARLACGVYTSVYAQIDPMRLAEMERALAVAREYGKRLTNSDNPNAKPETLQKLIADYPAHGFVIDAIEAKDLFHRVREPSEDEQKLVVLLKSATRAPIDDATPTVLFLNYERKQANDTEVPGNAPASH